MDHKTGSTKSLEGPADSNFAQLTVLREKERLHAIRHGLIDDPEKPKALADAQVFVGTCLDMCPLYEREQRDFQNDVKKWEIDPLTGKVDKRLAIKAFHRPAAGNEQALPSDVRPPKVLCKTLDHLIEHILAANDPLDKDTHGFVRDRTRSIRQDFTLQNERGMEAIACHESIVRFHILSLHQMCEIDGFDAHQEMEQLRKALQSLAEYYDDQRASGRSFPNESEFRAYHIITRLKDPDILRHVQTLPRHIRQDRAIRHALKLYKYAQRSNEEVGRFKPPNCEGSLNNYAGFFRLVAHRDTSYLLACLCETHFNDVRKGALKSMRKGFISAVKAPSLGELAEMLGCDESEEAEQQCEHYSIAVQMDDSGVKRAVLNKSSFFDESRPDMKQMFSERLVEAKRASMSFADIIHGRTSPVVEVTSPIAYTKKRTPSIRLFPHKESSQTYDQAHEEHPSVQAVRPSFGSRTGTLVSTPVITSATKDTSSESDPGLTRDLGEHREAFVAPDIQAIDVQQRDCINRDDILTQSSKKTVLHLVQAETDTAIQKAVSDREQTKLQEESLLNDLSADLVNDLIRNQLYPIVLHTYAAQWRLRKDKQNAWAKIKSAVANVRRRKEEAQMQREAEERRKREYEAAFEELATSQFLPRPRKRLRSRPCADGPIDYAKIFKEREIALRFWRPFDMDDFCKELPSSSGESWKILVVLSEPSLYESWMEDKLGTTNGSRARNSDGSGVEIQIISASSTADLGDVGALIYQCSADMEHNRSVFVSWVQEIAHNSDRCFPIIALSFELSSSPEILEQGLMIPKILADRKSPVTSYGSACLHHMEDVAVLEEAFRTMLRDTKMKPSPLAIERNVTKERETRYTPVIVEHPKSATPKYAQLRNSFYDLSVNPPAPPPDAPPVVARPEVIPAQILQLQETVRKARELLSTIKD